MSGGIVHLVFVAQPWCATFWGFRNKIGRGFAIFGIGFEVLVWVPLVGWSLLGWGLELLDVG